MNKELGNWTFAKDLEHHRMVKGTANDIMPFDYDNLMIDCETLSLDMQAVVLDITVIPFNNKFVGEPKIYKLNPQLQINDGRHIQMETVDFWFQQDKELASETLFRTRIDGIPKEQMTLLWHYILNFDDVKVWAKPAGADLVWLRSLFSQYYYNSWRSNGTPWKFYNARCLMTAMATRKVGADVPHLKSRPLLPHHGVSDCLAQIKLVQTLMHEGYLNGQ